MRMEEIIYTEEPDHPELATTVSNLAGVREAQVRLSEAVEGYERALMMYECYYFEQPNHVDLATTTHHLAGVYEAQGRLPEAAEGYERALRIKEVAYKEEPNHPELAATVYNLASVHEALGRLSEAAEGYERALHIEEKVYADEPNHPDLCATIQDLAGVHEALGRLAEAAEGYERAMRMLQTDSPDHPDLPTTVSKLVRVREAQGRRLSTEAGVSGVAPMVARTVGSSRYWSYGTPEPRPTPEPELDTQVALPSQPRHLRPAVFESDDLAGWMRPEALEYDGLLVKRPFGGAWDRYSREVDDARSRFGGQGLVVQAPGTSPHEFSLAVDRLLEAAALPAPLGAQIRQDAYSLASTWREICPNLEQFDVNLEIFGENTCARWHVDHFVGRAIITYTGQAGTDYTNRDNVNFKELLCCGESEHCIYDMSQTEQVAVGGMLLIKGSKFPDVSNPLVHKSPAKRYDSAGNIISRLVLKVDVHALKSDSEHTAVGAARAIKVQKSG
jgi:tetratricopeptide (TPR) repeat protein